MCNAQNICWLHQKGGATNLPEENFKTPKIWTTKWSNKNPPNSQFKPPQNQPVVNLHILMSPLGALG